MQKGETSEKKLAKKGGKLHGFCGGVTQLLVIMPAS